MRKIAKRNDKLFSRLEGIIDDNTANVEKSKIAVIMNEYFQNTVEKNMKLLQHLKQGFTE